MPVSIIAALSNSNALVALAVSALGLLPAIHAAECYARSGSAAISDE
jgi:hypothetical protein